MTHETSIPKIIHNPEYFFWGALLVAFIFFMQQPVFAVSPQTALQAESEVSTEARDDAFSTIELKATSAVVFDSTTGGLLFEKNATTSLPLASITKVMTAVVALAEVPDTTIVTISSEAIKQEGDSHLQVGERWMLRDLITFMLLESSNDAAYAISSSIGSIMEGTDVATTGRTSFITAMNEQAKALGLNDTLFRSESGLDVSSTEAGALSSAYDTARMFSVALKTFPDIFNKTRWSELVVENEQGDVRDAKNTNKSTDRLPLLLASKTGYTDLAGGNLVVAFNAGFNRPIVIAVLGSTVDGRFEDVEKLAWATLESL